jgi:predicted  nucleic acid-binding Zn-ribbon protein
MKVASLVPLQDLDLKIHRLRRSLAEVPGELAAAEGAVAARRAAVEEAVEKVKALKLEASKREHSIHEIEEEIKKFEGQVRLIKKNDEYQILMKEISSKKADKSLVEDGLLEIWGMVEHEEGLRRQKEKETAEAEAALAEVRRRVEARQAELGRELAAQEARRDQLRPSLNGELVALYERTQVSKEDGRGLAPLVAEEEPGGRGPGSFNCGGCNVNLTLQDANQVYVAREPFLCRNCARLLYVESASA